MGIIRLTLITIVLLGGALLYFGRDTGLPDNRIGREPKAETEALAAAVATEPAPESPAEAAPAEPAAAPEPATQPAETPDAGPDATALDAAVAEAMSTPEPPGEPGPPQAVEPTAPVAVEPAPPAAPVAAPEPVAETATLYVTGRTVNVRSGPSTSYAPIGALTRGAAVDDLGDAGNGWRMIRLPGGEAGYMSGDFLSPEPQ